MNQLAQSQPSQVVHIVKSNSNNPYLSNIKIIEIGDDTSAMPIADNTYIIKGYEQGHNHPSAHQWSVLMVADGEDYYSFGFTSADKQAMRPSQFRAVHNFFRSLGCNRHVYARAKNGIKAWTIR